MLAELIFGLISLLGGVAPSPPASTPTKVQTEPGRPAPLAVPPQTDLVPASGSGIVCTVRILRADPSIDAGIVRFVERDLDPKMVAPSVCGK